jgi:inner membrane protein
VDNLCHTLVGAALAESGLKRRTKFGYATLMIGANLPDIDGFAMFTGDGLGFRRGLTHGLPALVILPLLLTAAVVWWDRTVGRDNIEPLRRGQLLLLAGISILTHPILDWLNTYGMRWLMPLNGRWFYGDSLFIVDPWLLLMLGGGILTAKRLSRQGSAGAGRPAVLGLALSSAYIAGMLGLTAVGRMVAARDLGLVRPGPRQLMVEPVFLRSYRRRVVVDAGDRYRFGEIEWLPRPVLRMHAMEIPKGLGPAAVSRLGLDDRGRRFLDWARFPFYVIEGDQVGINDARYSRGGASWAMVRVRREQ